METFKSDNQNEPGKLVIVADDFTGASDTGVQFSKNKFRTFVITATERIKQSLSECDVLVVNTESRFDDHETAYRKTIEAGKIISAEEVKYFYKKLDSTMRGNIGAEIAGLMDSLAIGITFMVPALPRYGRTTVNGKVYVDGVLLEDSEFSKDPKNPVKESFIPKIISGQTDKRTAVIIHDYILAGRQILTQKLEHLISSGYQIVIFDAKEEQDIDLIASVISDIKQKVLFAGCSGLAEYLAKYLAIKKESTSNIVIAGSVSEVTRRQIDFASHYLRVKIVDVQTVRIFTPERNEEKKRILEITKECVSAGEDLIIRSAPSRESVKNTFEAGEEAGIDRFTISEAIAYFLGEVAREIIQNIGIKGILLTGGDTAYKTAKSLNISGIVLQDEIEHGIPYGYCAEEKYRNVIIVSKAGGFGNEDAIFSVLNFLRKV
jgi:D-threonate/D-erythronate kinase